MDPAAVALDVVRTAVVLLIVLTVLVGVHELGHFWAARAFGMHVEAFAVMMGGLRRTDLSAHLSRPLAPPSRVWAYGLASFVLVLAGFMSHHTGLLNAGLVAFGLGLPVWVATRLEALYHLRPVSGVMTLVKCWIGAILVILIATRFEGLASTQLFGLLSVSSLIGLLLVYYSPLRNKADESPQGHGKILVAGEEVAVRFRPLLSFIDRRGTEFSLLLLPLGGFAAIRGMHPREDGSEVSIDGGFYSKGPVPRLVVLFAGPLFSVLFGVLLIAGLYATVGVSEPSPEPVVGVVSADGPAGRAGIRAGDRILSVDGQPVETFYDLVVAIRDDYREVGGKLVAPEVTLSVRRGDDPDPLTFVVRPVVDGEPTEVLDSRLQPTGELRAQAKLLMGPERREVPLAPGLALARAAMLPVELVGNLGRVVLEPQRASRTIGGPGTVAQVTSAAAQSGVANVLTLAGLLSISLGVLNLLPIPPMDGGQMVVAFAELLRGGRRLSLNLQHTLQSVGFFLIVALSLAAVSLDIGKFRPRSEAAQPASQPDQSPR